MIRRDQHQISSNVISDNALKVLHRLREGGFDAYVVGGGVRDALVGRKPKDFDLATDANPEQIRSLFHNCRLIGKRFRLAHVYFGRDIVEVATFRGHTTENHAHAKRDTSGMILRDNVFGDITEDVIRRDFTINALYYNDADNTITDYVNGYDDIKDRCLRLIGDPETRYREDPVRMLRGIRMMAKLNLHIDKKTEAPIKKLGKLLLQVSHARIFDECIKMFLCGHSLEAYKLLMQYNLFQYLFPAANNMIQNNSNEFNTKFIEAAFDNTDRRLTQGKTINPAFLMSVLLWYPIVDGAAELRKQGLHPQLAMEKSIKKILTEQIKHTSIPKRIVTMMRDIWLMQHRLHRRRTQRAFHLLDHPRFRAAYDFMLLRNEAGENLQAICDWWTRFQDVDDHARTMMVKSLQKQPRAHSCGDGGWLGGQCSSQDRHRVKYLSRGYEVPSEFRNLYHAQNDFRWLLSDLIIQWVLNMLRVWQLH